MQAGGTITHVDDTKHDGHLHLVRVREEELVVGTMPGRVKTEGIGVTIRDRGHRLSPVMLRPRPARMEDVQRLGEDVVVEESGIDGEKTHEQDDVPTAASESVSHA